jgi:2-methylcitrate dehydratase
VSQGRAQPFPGHPKAPFTDAEIAQKVTANALPFAGQEVTDRIIAGLAGFERLGNVRDFTEILAFDWAKSRITQAA